MKPEKLYHGSPHPLKGKLLLPKQPTDLGNNPRNLIKSVYACSNRNVAIAAGIVMCKRKTQTPKREVENNNELLCN